MEQASEDLRRALAYAHAGRERAVADLVELVAIPSVSADPIHAADVGRAAGWVAARLRAIGFDVTVLETAGHPVVVGEWLGADAAPTVAFYAHYDVQPADGWTSPPFEATVRDGAVHGRGVRDDKGQLVAILQALEHAVGAGGAPVNLRVFFEGEEEVAGTSLGDLLRAEPGRWPTDAVVVVDGQFAAPGHPTLIGGLRGLLAFAVEVRGAAEDVHSGVYGGVAPNALNALAAILAGLKTDDGHVTVPGFYARVDAPSAEERAGWASLPITDRSVLDDLGVDALAGEPRFSALERGWARPTFDVHGLSGGYLGEGLKTVIPARARATASFRLVPGQDPDAIFAALQDHVAALASSGTSATVTKLAAAEPVAFDPESAAARAMRRALTATFGAEAVVGRLGGSIPVTTDLRDALTSEVVVVGFGLPDDGPHSTHERFRLEQFHGAADALLRFLHELAP